MAGCQGVGARVLSEDSMVPIYNFMRIGLYTYGIGLIQTYGAFISSEQLYRLSIRYHKMGLTHLQRAIGVVHIEMRPAGALGA